MQAKRLTPTDRYCKVLSPTIEHPIADEDLPGFRSHVRYSIFKERSYIVLPLAWREADGELSLEVHRCQLDCFFGGLVPAARAI